MRRSAAALIRDDRPLRARGEYGFYLIPVSILKF